MADLESDLDDLIDFAMDQSRALFTVFSGIDTTVVDSDLLIRSQSLEGNMRSLRQFPIVSDVKPEDSKPAVLLYGKVCMEIATEVKASAGPRVALVKRRLYLLDVTAEIVHMVLLRAYT